MSGIGVVSNPRSGQNRRRPDLARQLTYVLGEKGTLAEPDGLDGLDQVAREFRDRDIELLCINGGDGTVHRVMSAFHRAYGDASLPPVALLRGGTMNNVAHGLHIRGRPEVLLGRLVQRFHAGEPLTTRQRNLLVVNGTEAGFLFGNGLIVNFLGAYYAKGNPSPRVAAEVLLRAIGSTLVQGPFIRRLMQPVRCRVTVDGKAWEPQQYLSVAAGTIPDLGLGFRPFHGVEDHLDVVHFLGFACSVGRVVQRLWRIRLALPTNAPDILDQLGTHMTLESDEPLVWMMDGDFHPPATRLDITVGRRVQFVGLPRSG